MQTIKLNNDTTIPLIGLGTWNLNKRVASDVVRYAIVEAGYRHVDCAPIYGNESEVGDGLTKALQAGSIKREELFVTSKLWNTEHHPKRVEQACRETLGYLKLDYLDLYLMHWGIAFQPGGDSEPLDANGRVLPEAVSLQTTWQAMETLVEKGLVKSIGVSNFTAPMLLDLLTYAKIKPVMNQIELHPYLAQTELVRFCQYKEVVITAYSPFGTHGPQFFDDPIVKELADKYHKTQAQIVLRWAIDRGTIPIPKSGDTKHAAENIDIFDFALTADEQAKLTALNKNYRTCDPFKWWGVPYFA